ncbi:zona pellucida sperm-binding protein 3-like [Osmerus eperlanus]|uniref:zona pellucida sperm-binding protein 3-like n=1 Tax=Osmerus eperlanus TaxID=29151 RepID=UPI002E0EAA16
MSVLVAVMLFLVPAVAVNEDIEVDCGHTEVTVRWSDPRSQVEPSLLLLGTCSPNSLYDGKAVFHVNLEDCNFRRMVTGDQLSFLNDLTYIYDPAFSQPVVCAYERPSDWFPPLYTPTFNTYGYSNLAFQMRLMNADFTGPALSSAYPLGSIIPIMAAVYQSSHQPLLLLMEECFAAMTPQLQPDGPVYPIITNKGCLVDSKTTNSRFQLRARTSEMHLSLQAFKFALGEDVYIHCKLVAWDPEGLDSSKKACHFVKGHGWELLDDPARSNLCRCCDSHCMTRSKRGLASGLGIMKNTVLGPLTIIDGSTP